MIWRKGWWYATGALKYILLNLASCRECLRAANSWAVLSSRPGSQKRRKILQFSPRLFLTQSIKSELKEKLNVKETEEISLSLSCNDFIPSECSRVGVVGAVMWDKGVFLQRWCVWVSWVIAFPLSWWCSELWGEVSLMYVTCVSLCGWWSEMR